MKDISSLLKELKNHDIDTSEIISALSLLKESLITTKGLINEKAINYINNNNYQDAQPLLILAEQVNDCISKEIDMLNIKNEVTENIAESYKEFHDLSEAVPYSKPTKYKMNDKMFILDKAGWKPLCHHMMDTLYAEDKNKFNDFIAEIQSLKRNGCLFSNIEKHQFRKIKGSNIYVKINADVEQCADICKRLAKTYDKKMQVAWYLNNERTEPLEISNLKIGMRLHHEKFGMGSITEINKEKNCVYVDFDVDYKGSRTFLWVPDVYKRLFRLEG